MGMGVGGNGRAWSAVLCAVAVVVLLVGGAACSPTDLGQNPRDYTIDGSDPVSVVEGYLHTWENQSWDVHEQLVDADEVDLTQEPSSTIERLSILLLEGDASAAVCEASFNLMQVIDAAEPDGEPVVERTRHTWTFSLDYFSDRDSYVITQIERD